jgi:hypothetical protein
MDQDAAGPDRNISRVAMKTAHPRANRSPYRSRNANRELKKSRISVARLVCHWLKRHRRGATKVKESVTPSTSSDDPKIALPFQPESPYIGGNRSAALVYVVQPIAIDGIFVTSQLLYFISYKGTLARNVHYDSSAHRAGCGCHRVCPLHPGLSSHPRL